jgi:phosphoglycerol transferase MdoB-like AlkP superfamily enzyme
MSPPSPWLDYARIMAWLALPYLLICTLLRVILWWQFAFSEGVSLAHMPGILALGVINDTVEVLYLLLPFTLLFLLSPPKPAPSRRLGLMFMSYAWLFGVLYVASAEYFFFEEFNARFNLVAVDYLIYPHEVFINIWESYPVVPALMLNALISALVLWLLWPQLAPRHLQPVSRQKNLLPAGAHLGLVVLAALGFSTHALASSHNRLVTELTANGISSFFEALRTNELDYKQYYRTGDEARLLPLLTTELGAHGGEFTRLNEGHLDRHHPGRTEGLGKLNVVLITEESFGAEFVGTYGDTRGLTPAFDRLAQQGVLFRHAYATGTRTVRGLEALVTSFPPIPSESIVKRPGNEGIATWGQVMREHGYHTSFLYGGFGYFDNMNYFFSHNGFAVSDRSDIPEPNFANIWGVSDEDLFNHARTYFDQRHAENTPFFSVLMTTSNHKPYTFPADVPGVAPQGGGRDAGIRYADYALGKFIEAAQEHAWFDNTLFVIVADHGARVYGKAEIPLHSYEIPLLLLAPAHLQAQVITRPTSQIDVAPTVLGLLGLEYSAPFFGQDALADTQSPVLLFNHNHNVALYRDGKLAVLGLQQQANVYAYHYPEDTLEAVAPETELLDLAAAYYQVAFEQFKQHRYE